MSQNAIVLPTTGTVSGLQMAQKSNDALDTLNTLASGASAPSTPEAGQLWHDTANNLLKIRSLDNTAWVPFLQINESTYQSLPYSSSPAGGANRVLNAAMLIDQANQGAGYSVPNNNTPTYTCDQWVVSCGSSGASALTAQQVTDAPAGFRSSLKITVGGGAGGVTGGDFLYAYQPIEANNLDDLAYGTSAAAATSLSFWVKSSIAGTFAAVLQNAAGLRSIVNKFTIASSGVWQQITIPNIPGDQAGTWATGNSAMLNLFIVLATGPTDQTISLNTWLTGDFLGSTTQTNSVLTTSGATFQITGVMFNAGAFCLPYEKKSIQRELLDCLRYYYQLNASINAAIGTGWASSANVAEVFIPFPVPMRVLSTYKGPSTVGHVSGNFQTATAVAASNSGVATVNQGSIQVTVASGIAAAAGTMVRWASSAVTDSMSWSARM